MQDERNPIIKMPLKILSTLCAAGIIITSLSLVSCKKKTDTLTPPPPVKVRVMEVSPSSDNRGREYSGTVTAAETTTVSFAVAGTITELYVKEGQKISKGQLLGKLRNGEYQNAYNIAEAQLAEAQDGYDRLKKLHDANALPEVKWVEIEQKLKQARNAAEMAKRTLDDANLYSPCSGTVTRKFADAGQTVVPVEPIYEITSVNDLTIDVGVSEREIGSFSIGEKAFVTIPVVGNDAIEGKVSSKSDVADDFTRNYRVKVSIPDIGGKILPGMIGSVEFVGMQDSGEEKDMINLPSQAVLLNDDNRWFVWIVKDSIAERRFITVDQLTSDGVTVEKGLNLGDLVIVEGIRKVGSGTRVDIVN